MSSTKAIFSIATMEKASTIIFKCVCSLLKPYLYIVSTQTHKWDPDSGQLLKLKPRLKLSKGEHPRRSGDVKTAMDESSQGPINSLPPSLEKSRGLDSTTSGQEPKQRGSGNTLPSLRRSEWSSNRMEAVRAAKEQRNLRDGDGKHTHRYRGYEQNPSDANQDVVKMVDEFINAYLTEKR